MNKIKAASPDKVRGKLVKYGAGDCLSIHHNNKYLAAFIPRKFNKYYDITLLEFYSDNKPALDDFRNGKFFGTRFGSWGDLIYAANIRMITCKYIDENAGIDKVGSLQLIPSLINDGYDYLNNTDELVEYYIKELPVRIEKSKIAEKYPDLAFVSRHLVDMSLIIQ